MTSDETVAELNAAAEHGIALVQVAERLSLAIQNDEVLRDINEFVRLDGIMLFVGVCLREMARRDEVSEEQVLGAVETLVRKLIGAVGNLAIGVVSFK
jgi:hypothetical protein